MSQTQFPRPPSETLPTMYDLPSEDPGDMGLPDEFHDFQPQLLRETCKPPTYSAADFFVGTDLNLYYDGRHPQWYKRPDWFLALGVSIGDQQQDMRLSYVLWQEFISPFLVVELLSPGTADEDLGRNIREISKPPIKWEVYEKAHRVPFYVVFDRYENHFRLFSLTDGKYRERQLDETNPRFWFDELELGLGVWSGYYEGFEGQWLRWYDRQNNWIPTAIEQTELATQQAYLATKQAALERSGRLRAESQLAEMKLSRRSAIPQLIGLGLTIEQIATSLGLTILEVQAVVNVESIDTK